MFYKRLDALKGFKHERYFRSAHIILFNQRNLSISPGTSVLAETLLAPLIKKSKRLRSMKLSDSMTLMTSMYVISFLSSSKTAI